jgi:ketosteroid isomerase-like protein
MLAVSGNCLADGNATVLAAFRAASQAKFAIKQQAFRNGDADALTKEFYRSDAVIIGDDYSISGGAAINKAYKELLPKRRDIEIVPLRSSVSDDGTLAYELVRTQATASDPVRKLPEQTVLFIWSRSGGEWKVAVEMSAKGASVASSAP